MSLTPEDVSRIALLSRIELSPAERETTREQLNGILGFIEQLQAVDTAGIEPMAPTRSSAGPNHKSRVVPLSGGR